MTVGELLERASSRELASWRAYDRLEPIGSLRADLHVAMLATLMFNLWRDPKEPMKTVADFMPVFDEVEYQERVDRLAREGAKSVLAGWKPKVEAETQG